MNELMIFEGHQVEVFEYEGKVLFNPKDVADCLDIADVNSSIRNFNGKQVVKLTNSKMHDMQFRKLHNTGENFLTESGVYKLIFKSHKPDAEKFQDWVTDEVLPAIRKTGSYAKNQPSEAQVMRAQAQLMNAQVRKAKMYAELAKVETLSATYKEVMVAKAADTLNGGEVIPLPKLTRKTFTATEVGEILGVSSQKVGAITNKHNLKTAEYGEWYRDKAKWSNKEVDTFKYYDNVIPVIKGYLGAQ